VLDFHLRKALHTAAGPRTLDVALALPPGELLALRGPSGAGKTTLLRLLAGLDRPDAGFVRFEEQTWYDGPRRQWLPPRRRPLGFVFQDYALFPNMTVRENLAFAAEEQPDKKQVVSELLELLELGELAARRPALLSGGQQQRVALARALAPEPAVILLDEPFSNLDAELRASVRAEVRQILADAGATAVLVTHDQEEALSLADRVAVMWGGEIVQESSPEELYHRPVSRAVAAFVGEAQFLPGEGLGRRVASELGELPAHGGATGPVDVMLRPEGLRLALDPDHAAGGTNATVLTRSFYGHDQLMTVRLDTGRVLRARLGTYGGIRPGDRVAVSVRGAVLTFPREG